MMWAGIHDGGRTALVHVADAPTDIIYRDEVLQHYVIQQMNVKGGMFQHDIAMFQHDMAIRVRSFCGTTKSRPYFGLLGCQI